MAKQGGININNLLIKNNRVKLYGETQTTNTLMDHIISKNLDNQEDWNFYNDINISLDSYNDNLMNLLQNVNQFSISDEVNEDLSPPPSLPLFRSSSFKRPHRELDSSLSNIPIESSIPIIVNPLLPNVPPTNNTSILPRTVSNPEHPIPKRIKSPRQTRQITNESSMDNPETLSRTVSNYSLTDSPKKKTPITSGIEPALLPGYNLKTFNPPTTLYMNEEEDENENVMLNLKEKTKLRFLNYLNGIIISNILKSTDFFLQFVSFNLTEQLMQDLLISYKKKSHLKLLNDFSLDFIVSNDDSFILSNYNSAMELAITLKTLFGNTNDILKNLTNSSINIDRFIDRLDNEGRKLLGLQQTQIDHEPGIQEGMERDDELSNETTDNLLGKLNNEFQEISNDKKQKLLLLAFINLIFNFLESVLSYIFQVYIEKTSSFNDSILKFLLKNKADEYCDKLIKKCYLRCKENIDKIKINSKKEVQMSLELLKKAFKSYSNLSNVIKLNEDNDKILKDLYGFLMGKGFLPKLSYDLTSTKIFVGPPPEQMAEPSAKQMAVLSAEPSAEQMAVLSAEQMANFIIGKLLDKSYQKLNQLLVKLNGYNKGITELKLENIEKLKEIYNKQDSVSHTKRSREGTEKSGGDIPLFEQKVILEKEFYLNFDFFSKISKDLFKFITPYFLGNDIRLSKDQIERLFEEIDPPIEERESDIPIVEERESDNTIVKKDLKLEDEDGCLTKDSDIKFMTKIDTTNLYSSPVKSSVTNLSRTITPYSSEPSSSPSPSLPPSPEHFYEESEQDQFKRTLYKIHEKLDEKGKKMNNNYILYKQIDKILKELKKIVLELMYFLKDKLSDTLTLDGETIKFSNYLPTIIEELEDLNGKLFELIISPYHSKFWRCLVDIYFKNLYSLTDEHLINPKFIYPINFTTDSPELYMLTERGIDLFLSRLYQNFDNSLTLFKPDDFYHSDVNDYFKNHLLPTLCEISSVFNTQEIKIIFVQNSDFLFLDEKLEVTIPSVIPKKEPINIISQEDLTPIVSYSKSDLTPTVVMSPGLSKSPIDSQTKNIGFGKGVVVSQDHGGKFPNNFTHSKRKFSKKNLLKKFNLSKKIMNKKNKTKKV